MFRCSFRGLTLGLLALVFVANSVDAQGVGMRREQSAGQGWIGIRSSMSLSMEDGREALFVVISETVDRGPAAEAGLLPGDTIYRVDGRSITLRRWDRLTSRLTPGDDVSFSVQREGRSHDVVVRVGLRPKGAPTSDARNERVGYSSVQNSITSRIDAVRDRYANDSDYAVVIRGDSNSVAQIRIVERIGRIGRAVSEGVIWATSGSVGDSTEVFELRFGADPGDPGPTSVSVVPEPPSAWKLIETALPFEFFILNTPAADSVKTVLFDMQMKVGQNRKALVQLRGLSEAASHDDEIVHLRDEEARMQFELTTLAARLREIGDDERQVRRVVERERQRSVQTAPAPRTSRTSTRTAALVGRNFVAGAQLTNLNPGLSEYFGVLAGVLVMDVLKGSLAAQAELIPGDVIIRIDDRACNSMSELRAALASPRQRGENTITVVRKGDRIRLALPR